MDGVHRWPILARLRLQTIRFIMAGSVAGLADLGTYALLTKVLGFHPLHANLVSRPLGGLISFTLNKYWTFENRGRASAPHQFLRYALIWIALFSGSEGLVGLYHSALGLEAVTAKLAAEATLGVISFLMHKFWTFR